ncbi:MAG TPA: LiaF domain-containing protein [Gemmatimonadaceae bacterium]|jgi:hypothetical protein
MNSPTSSPPAVVPPRLHPTLEAHQVPERRGTVAILSNTRRDADWILPRLFRVFTFWGNVELDLTHALLGAGTSVIDIRCIMANVEIKVPPGLRVESEVDAVLGSADVRREIASTTSLDAPRVRIIGSTLLGSIEIKVIDPNAPSLGERIRRRIFGRAKSGAER